MFFGEKPKGTSIGPKLVSQLVMIGAAVYAAVGLHVSEAIVGNQDGPLYVATSVAYPLLYDAAFLMGVLSLCLYVWGGKRFVLTLLVVGLACHAGGGDAVRPQPAGARIPGRADLRFPVAGWAARSSSGRRPSISTRRAPAAGEEPLGEQFLIAAYRRARRLEPLIPALGIVRHLAHPRARRRRPDAHRGAGHSHARLLGVRDRGRDRRRVELAHRGRICAAPPPMRR